MGEVPFSGGALLSKGLVTRFLVVVMTCVGIGLWYIIAGANINILVSAVISISLLTLIGCAFHGGFWRGVSVVLGDWPPVFFLIFCTVTTYAFASVTSGDWGPFWGAKSDLASVCIPIGRGWLHIHHWAEGLILLGIMVRIIVNYRRYTDAHGGGARGLRIIGRRLLAISLVLIVSAVWMYSMHWTDSRRSIWLVAGWLGLFLGPLLGTACLSGEYSRCTFRTVLAIGLGVALGTTCNGAVEAMQDLVHEHSIPSPLIFYVNGGDDRCGS